MGVCRDGPFTIQRGVIYDNFAERDSSLDDANTSEQEAGVKSGLRARSPSSSEEIQGHQVYSSWWGCCLPGVLRVFVAIRTWIRLGSTSRSARFVQLVLLSQRGSVSPAKISARNRCTEKVSRGFDFVRQTTLPWEVGCA